MYLRVFTFLLTYDAHVKKILKNEMVNISIYLIYLKLKTFNLLYIYKINKFLNFVLSIYMQPRKKESKN